MAAYKFISATVTLEYEVGLKENGDAIYKAQTVHNVSNSASAEQLNAVCAGIASLKQAPTLRYRKDEKYPFICYIGLKQSLRQFIMRCYQCDRRVKCELSISQNGQKAFKWRSIVIIC